jgi:hypothetical protein
MMYYYSADGSSRTGPISSETLKKLVAAKILPATVPICKEGSNEWRAFEDEFSIASPAISGLFSMHLNWQQALVVTILFFSIPVGIALLLSGQSNNSSPVATPNIATPGSLRPQTIPPPPATHPQNVTTSTPAKPKESAKEREARITKELYRTLAERDLRKERDAEKQRRIRDAIELEKELIRLQESKQ